MRTKYTIILILLSAVATISCNDFVELDSPKTQIVRENVFSTDVGARGAVTGIFSQMMSSGTFASGSSNGITTVAGLSADELINYSVSQERLSIYNNNLLPNNGAVTSNWNEMYLYIYEANSVIEGASAAGISKKVKDQVVGEAKFVRAFSYFYLVNLYGDVPLVLSTDYRVNKDANRTAVSEVYKQIENDLIDAENLLLEDYSFSLDEKTEPNKWAAIALLARVYLYQKKWNESQQKSTAIIDNGTFALEPDLNSVFLANSTEAIWQLMPVLPGLNTNEAPYMVIISNPTRVSLSSTVTNVFEANDNRLSEWIGTYTGNGGKTYNYAYKYKVNLRDEPLTEYYTVFRLAEQYLIRAEAYAMQGNLDAAVDDVNEIRVRAGLGPIDSSGLDQQQVLEIIDKERRAELFAEWGHRWFDLKRSGKIDAILGSTKPDWQSKDALFPIPQAEIRANPNLVQNP